MSISPLDGSIMFRGSRKTSPNSSSSQAAQITYNQQNPQTQVMQAQNGQIQIAPPSTNFPPAVKQYSQYYENSPSIANPLIESKPKNPSGWRYNPHSGSYEMGSVEQVAISTTNTKPTQIPPLRAGSHVQYQQQNIGVRDYDTSDYLNDYELADSYSGFKRVNDTNNYSVFSDYKQNSTFVSVPSFASSAVAQLQQPQVQQNLQIPQVTYNKTSPYLICPICYQKATQTCNCTSHDSSCANKHQWHVENGKIILGSSHG